MALLVDWLRHPDRELGGDDARWKRKAKKAIGKEGE
tara:strand:+ start:1201 stop:1308 length:108 start_codon:yes stop_codon:yes gene_type:complete